MRAVYKIPEKYIFDSILDIINELYNDKEIEKKEDKIELSASVPQKGKFNSIDSSAINTDDCFTFVPKEAVVLKQYDPKKIFSIPKVEKVLFRDPATIVWFSDGTKSVAICGYDDIYDRETGVAICLCKRMLGNKEYRELMDEWCYKKENLN
jgi:hypothetical protein